MNKLKLREKAPASAQWSIAVPPVGQLVVAMTEANEICRIAFLKDRKPLDIIAEWQRQWPGTVFSRGGKLDDIGAMPVVMVGTSFQHSVWQAMAKVPAGKVTTYGEIARDLGKPKAARAVGAACGANPLPYLVPCHRVLAANGTLKGFSGGLDVKEKLLKAEGYL